MNMLFGNKSEFRYKDIEEVTELTYNLFIERKMKDLIQKRKNQKTGKRDKFCVVWKALQDGANLDHLDKNIDKYKVKYAK
mmetsp:Transcript_512/g.1028  ORF Transcript_512/g.1028 Transcript_512/m.1028 type:complete len:80 (+) Transcript_512:157-396(+)|eukprot:CAMPEP_0116920076 /NCGR_PEP_ID=MMETSP0467-20121206/20787_1 /TAXON_ID=283647 /ORGANISM="Mesodinium pulex, Strain SPMC105" /LENGTH=79 /DNA_ID=CAMNT_0004597819 /DNA_START=519 /DNA_END=758 /DNA_ORIENTATION=+